MKKITFLFLFATMMTYSQTTLFTDDFESHTDFIISGITNWLTIDGDGLNTYTAIDNSDYPNAGAIMAYQIFNPSTTTPTAGTNSSDPNTDPNNEVRNFDPHSGSKYIVSWAGVPAAPVVANDDWLISPVIDLAASGNSVSFWVKALSNTYGDEDYEVGVYVGSGTPTGGGDFTIISNGAATYPAWEEISLNLDAYNDQEIRIGIHYTASDVYMLMIDDFTVSTTLSIDEFETSAFSHFYDSTKHELTINSGGLPFNTIGIYNILGQNVLNRSLTQTTEIIDLSTLKDGIYLARMTINEVSQTIKIVKR